MAKYMKSREHFTNPDEGDQTDAVADGDQGGGENIENSDNIGGGQETPTIDFSQYVLKSSIKPCRDCRDIDPNYIHKKNMPPTCTVELANNKSDYVKKSSVPPCNCPPCPDCVCPPPPDVKVCSKLVEEEMTDDTTGTSNNTSTNNNNNIQDEQLEEEMVSQESEELTSVDRQNRIRQSSEIDRKSRVNVDQQVNINRKINKTTSEDILPQERRQVDLIDGEEEIREMSANVGSEELVRPDNSNRESPGVEYRSRQMTPSEEEVDNTDMFTTDSVNNGFCPEAMDTLGNTDFHAWGTQFT